ncbi:MAG: 4-hydroxybenzoate octaprenyltransferase [Pseudomonadota bacterium]
MNGDPLKPAAIGADADRVADAPTDNWVYSLLPRSVWPYAQLARWDRPIGWWLLLWPCWWSLTMALLVALRDPTLAAQATDLVLGFAVLYGLFWLGSVAMRGAGCTYNDMVDETIDAQVERTASRPIPSGRVSQRQARIFMLAQVLAGAMVLLALCSFVGAGFNQFAFVLAVSSLVIVACYPFAKRVTDWPQLVLGLAFSWGALMGWAVIFRQVEAPSLFLYAGSITWVIGYDTIYAHQDREDDALVGVRSTARLFGERSQLAIFLLYAFALAMFALAYMQADLGLVAYAGLVLGGAQMLSQIVRLDINNGDKCLALFKSNNQFGLIILAFLLLDFVV